MSKNVNYVSHKKSKQKNQDGSPKLPVASALVEGEIAINFAENVETLSILNESGNVVTFSSDNYYSEKKLGSAFTGANSAVTVTEALENIEDNEMAIAAALNDLNSRKMDSSAYTEIWESGTGESSAVLKGSSGTASGDYSVAEGYQTSATSLFSHAEGQTTLASGVGTHAEGNSTSATSVFSHAEGQATLASNVGTHAEGQSTRASGNYSHAEGYSTSATNTATHAEGYMTLASGSQSHAEGYSTSATSTSTHAEGNMTLASGYNSHAEGNSTIASGTSSHAEGDSTSATNQGSHAEGNSTIASGNYSHAEGAGSIASEYTSHAEGSMSKANGTASHAEGSSTIANGSSSHAEGIGTLASGNNSHTEGYSTSATSQNSHTEGMSTIASGYTSHAEGAYTKAIGYYSHAEGYLSESVGEFSHVEGNSTIANNWSEHASGQYNVSSSGSSTFGDSGNTLFSVGNGTASNARHNAFEIRQNGDIYIVNKGGDDVRLQDEIGNIDVDQVLDDTTSASTNPVSSKAVYKAVTDNELVWTNAFVVISGAISSHTEDTSMHVTSADKSDWDAKLDASDVEDFFDDAKYELSGTTHVINFYNGNTIKATIDATDFIKDGMIDSVSLETTGGTTYLVITWNTDAGKSQTSLNVGDLFDADNYYTKDETSGKTEISNALGGKVSTAAFTAFNTEYATFSAATNTSIEDLSGQSETVAAALNDLESRKMDASAYTPTDLSNYYTKDETSGKTEISNALGGKVNTATFTTLNNVVTAHTANTDIHLTITEKGQLHTHTNKTYLDGITGTVGTMAYENASSYSSATQVSTALANKLDKTEYATFSAATNTSIEDLSGQSQTIAAALNDLNANKLDKTDAFSGDYNDLTNKPIIIQRLTISSNTSSVCSITGSSNSGKGETIIYVNGGSSDVTVTVPTTYQTPDGAAIELTCPVGGYCEVSYLNIDGVIYARGL